MQGTIVKIVVEEGQEVAEGDTVVVLEAMKMEQPLKAHKAGTVTGLQAEVGATVTNGAVICELKDCLRPIGTPKVCRSQRVLDAQVEAGLDAADREGRDRDPAVVESGQELGEAAAALTEQVARGHRQSWKVSGWVSEACQPSLSYAGSTMNPSACRRAPGSC